MKTDQNTPKLSGFIFNEKLGLYVNQMLLSRGRLSEDSTKREVSAKCKELYDYYPWESGYNDYAYLAAGSLGLLTGNREDISFTFQQATELAKVLGVRLGNDREFTVDDNCHGTWHSPLLLGDIYDFTRDGTEIDVYLGITTVLQDENGFHFLDEHGEPIKPLKVKGAQARALRDARSGDRMAYGSTGIMYKDESAFLNSGKRVTEFDEHGIPCVLDNQKYGCIPREEGPAHAHTHLSEYLGQRWEVDPKKGIVVMSKLETYYVIPVSRSTFRSVSHVGATATYLTTGIEETFWKTNIFAVADLENKVEESLKSLVNSGDN